MRCIARQRCCGHEGIIYVNTAGRTFALWCADGDGGRKGVARGGCGGLPQKHAAVQFVSANTLLSRATGRLHFRRRRTSRSKSRTDPAQSSRVKGRRSSKMFQAARLWEVRPSCSPPAVDWPMEKLGEDRQPRNHVLPLTRDAS